MCAGWGPGAFCIYLDGLGRIRVFCLDLLYQLFDEICIFVYGKLVAGKIP